VTDKPTLLAEISTNLPDNTTGLITPALLRSTLIDILNFVATPLTGLLAAQGVDTYGAGSNSGVAGYVLSSSDSSVLTGTERYTAWVGNTSAGTTDGSVIGATYALGVSMVKANWQTTTVAGEVGAINLVARGGDNNVIASGDTSGITANVAVSRTNNFAVLLEGVCLYTPAGSTTGSTALDCQVGPIRQSGLGDVQNSVSYGYFTQAQNGANGVAFGASNLKTSPRYGGAATWNYFLKYDNDDGTHAVYTSFAVLPSGWIYIAGPGAAGANSKIIRVGGSVTNNLEVVNAANTAVILSLSDSGVMQFNGAAAIAANGTVATTMTSLGPTGSHTTIQEWLTYLNPSGVTRYIPAY
jgi:hypothetical protein